MNVFDEFSWRGLVHSYTEGLPEYLDKNKTTLYIGFDPTSKSLQVGNLLALMGLARMQRFGHTPVALAGGGTGMIGDPSGKQQERTLLTLDEVNYNVTCIKEQLARFLDFEVKANTAIIANNADWLRVIPMMDFLRDVGKHFTVNYMMAKDSVKSRLEREDGISYTEFSYMLMQAFDFLKLNEIYGVEMQSGGSDQWGNIIAGVELIRRKTGATAHGLVYPLVTDAAGNKLGKTAKGAIYLDAEMTSPYHYYQFWLRQEDVDVIDFLKYFTWFTQDEIADFAARVAQQPEAREAQRALAREMTRMTHGESELAKAEQVAEVLFGGDIEGLNARDIADVFVDAPSTEITKASFEGEGLPLVDLYVASGQARGKGDARRSIEGGGMYINNARAVDAQQMVTLHDTIEGQFIVLRKGKKNYHLIKVI